MHSVTDFRFLPHIKHRPLFTILLMKYLGFVFFSIYGNPWFYLISLSVIIIAQTLISFLIMKIINIFTQKGFSQKYNVFFMLMASGVVSLPGSWFLSNMMCFTATNNEAHFIRVIFIFCYIILSVVNYIFLTTIRGRSESL
jgi:hypothetical protein